MIAHALVLLTVLSGTADELTVQKLPGLTIKVPAAWKHHVLNGTQRYSAPSGDAYFNLDVDHTAAPMDANACEQKILAKMGEPDAWTTLVVDNNPAARKLDIDQSPDGATKAQTYTYLGCNGKTTWSLVFFLASAKQGRFAPLAEAIAKSVKYSP